MRSNLNRLLPLAAVCLGLFSAGLYLEASHAHSPKPLDPRADLHQALTAITPASLRGDLSFLSSDALAGRYTPSTGLDVAADFIASRFRASDLNAPVDGTYFQDADLTPYLKANPDKHVVRADRPVQCKNVIGILRGSDPVLRNTYIIVSAHYDHIGTLKTASGLTSAKPTSDHDEIYNGANDDGSGTVSVIALAKAFANLRERPKRSIIFMTFCGEELGLLGSRFYAEHPVVPLKQTIADINLEQVGRSDGDISRGSASLTGFGFTSLGALFEHAGESYGIRIYRDQRGDKYFRASDNYSLAKYGVPDSTLCAAFEFPDYHGLKDDWGKIDYFQMADIDKLAAEVVWALANSKTAPSWNANDEKTKSFRDAAAVTYGGASILAAR
jgi:Zn-dependent M28 family amino/carboxypeptidase